MILRLGLLQFAQDNIVGLGLTNFYEGFTNLYINQYIYHKLNINYMYNTNNYSYSDVYYHSSPRQSFHRGTKRGDWDARRVWVPGVWKWDPKMGILRFMLIGWDVYNDIVLSVISIIVVVIVLLSTVFNLNASMYKGVAHVFYSTCLSMNNNSMYVFINIVIIVIIIVVHHYYVH